MHGITIYKRIGALFLLVILVICMSMHCVALDAKKSKTIRIGYIDYEAFITQQEDGHYVGYGVEYLNKISRITGWNYEYVYDTWPNHLENLKNGDIDFLCHAQKTPDRLGTYLFSTYSNGTETNLLYARSDDERFYYNDFQRFDGMTVGLLENSFQNEQLSELARRKGFAYKVKYYDSSQDTFDALDRGEVDTVAMGSVAAITGYKIVARISADPFLLYDKQAKSDTD